VPRKRKLRNSTDDEILALRRKAAEGDLSAVDEQRLSALLSRSNLLTREELARGELPDLEDFVKHATAWADNEIRLGLRKRGDPPLIYGIDLTTQDTVIDDLVLESGFERTSLDNREERSSTSRKGVTSHREWIDMPVMAALRERSEAGDLEADQELRRLRHRQNTTLMTFPTWEDVHEYLSYLVQIMNQELEFDTNMSDQSIIVEEGVWYIGEAGGEGFDIPPGVTGLAPSGDQDTEFPELSLVPPPRTPEDPTPSSETIMLADEIEETEKKLEANSTDEQDVRSSEDLPLTTAERKVLEDRLARLKEIHDGLEDYVLGGKRGIIEVTAQRGYGAALTGNDQYDWFSIYATADEAINALAEQYDIRLPDEIEALETRTGEMANEILKAAGYEWESENEGA
jgi:hypothetical protein